MARTRAGAVVLAVTVGIWLAVVPIQAQDPAASPVPRAEQEPSAQAVNVRVTLAIAQEVEGREPDTRNVVMVLADGLPGRVRAGARPLAGASGPTGLNVDATASVMAGGRVRVQLTVEHIPVPPTRAEAVATHTATHLNESLTVYLDSGVPLVVSEAADPITGLRTTVEVTATVLE